MISLYSIQKIENERKLATDREMGNFGEMSRKADYSGFHFRNKT